MTPNGLHWKWLWAGFAIGFMIAGTFTFIGSRDSVSLREQSAITSQGTRIPAQNTQGHVETGSERVD